MTIYANTSFEDDMEQVAQIRIALANTPNETDTVTLRFEVTEEQVHDAIHLDRHAFNYPHMYADRIAVALNTVRNA